MAGNPPRDLVRPRGLVGLLRRAGSALLALPAALVGVACAGWMFLIWSLSTREGSDMPASGYWPVIANMGHAFLFGILCLLLAALVLRPVLAGGWPALDPRRILGLLLAVGAYGFLDEWHQSRVPGRAPSVLDILTDLVGAACVLWIIAYLGRDDAAAGGLRKRLLVGVCACAAAALLGTALPSL
jgi:VanZ family protein